MSRVLLMLFLLLPLHAENYIDEAEAYFQNEEYKKAYPLYLRSANENQKSEAAYKLGWMCEYGKATELESETALYWYKKAAEWELTNSNKKKVYETVYRNLDPLGDEESTDTLVQLANGKFGLRAYYPNYAVVSYTDQIPKGETKYEEGGSNPDGVGYINTEVKYQISLRADYITNWFGFVQMWTGAYTQTSYWQIFIESAPFRDTNYKPEAFVTIPLFHKADVIGLKGFALGYKHSSNGQPVDDNATRDPNNPNGPKVGSRSRSWNRLYARTYFQWDHFFAELDVWYKFKEPYETDDNPDIEEYYGQGSLELGYINKKLLTRLTLRPSFTKGHITGELEMSYPVPLSDNVFFYFQAFSGVDTDGNVGGYGQSLIDYDQQVNQVGFGLSISR